MPRVLHLLASDDRRGAESSGLALSEAMARHGLDSRTVAVTRGRAELGLPVLGRHWGDPRGLGRLRAAAVDADVVVAHGGRTLWSAALGLLGTRTPFVYVNIGDPLYWASSGLKQRRVGRLLARAAAVCAVSPRSVEPLVTVLGVPRQRVRHIPNGRAVDRYRPADAAQRAAARIALGLPADADVVAYVGSMAPEKRVDVALRAVARLPGVHLALAGSGPLLDEHRRLAEQLLPGRAHFLGVLRRVDQLLAAADALVLSSDSEGVPGVLVEAGLAGVPAATTDVGFTTDVVVDGVTGAVAPAGDPVALADALQRVLDDRAALGAAAREHCLATFDLERVVEAWIDLVEDVRGAAH